MKKIVSFYFNKLIASIVTHLWAGIWTAIGFIMIMKITDIFIIVTG